MLLGVPIDVYEPSKGWVEINTDGAFKESPKSLDLKDGSEIAFTFLEGATGAESINFHVEYSVYDGQEDGVVD